MKVSKNNIVVKLHPAKLETSSPTDDQNLTMSLHFTG
jgi:hypothetical protein